MLLATLLYLFLSYTETLNYVGQLVHLDYHHDLITQNIKTCTEKLRIQSIPSIIYYLLLKVFRGHYGFEAYISISTYTYHSYL